MYGLDTSEELVVEHQRIAVGREERGGFLLHLAELIGTIGGGERREQSRGTGEQSARLLEGQDRVLEGRSLGIIDDTVDLSRLLCYALLEGREEVLGLDTIECRSIEVECALDEERIVRRGLAVASGKHSEKTECEDETFCFHWDSE